MMIYLLIVNLPDKLQKEFIMDILKRSNQIKVRWVSIRVLPMVILCFQSLKGNSSEMMFRGKEVLTWSLNNYLGLASLPEVKKADADATKEYGLAYPMGARMMSGQTTMHEKFEKMAAEFTHKGAAYLLNYGYQGMVSIIDALVDRHDVIVYDSESHACIMDGLRLHMGKDLSITTMI